MTVRQQVESLLAVLPHVATRIPYTHHHDYLRCHAPRFQGSSRGDVASYREHPEEQLYILALMQVVEGQPPRFMATVFDAEQQALFRQLAAEADAILLRY